MINMLANEFICIQIFNCFFLIPFHDESTKHSRIQIYAFQVHTHTHTLAYLHMHARVPCTHTVTHLPHSWVPAGTQRDARTTVDVTLEHSQSSLQASVGLGALRLPDLRNTSPKIHRLMKHRDYNTLRPNNNTF